jgi:hypothetical protein
MMTYRRFRQSGLLGNAMRFLFFLFNVLMFIWLISYWIALSEQSAVTAAEKAGSALGGVLGTILLSVIWLAGAVLLSALSPVRRGPKIMALRLTTLGPRRVRNEDGCSSVPEL